MLNLSIPRVLANESEVFTLDDHNYDPDRRTVVLNSRDDESVNCEKSRLVDCPLDSDEEKETVGKEVGQNIRARNTGSLKERSRLTDSFDLDGESLSDDLDLLPPAPGIPNSNWTTKFKSLNCCNPRIPSKCNVIRFNSVAGYSKLGYSPYKIMLFDNSAFFICPHEVQDEQKIQKKNPALTKGNVIPAWNTTW
uniref:DDE_Tnp_1_7 domain-containing protein n=1 Tax=Heterorhabditis bacteriophora TaxID=37862 RepID=A0A1I7WGE9_HETBA